MAGRAWSVDTLNGGLAPAPAYIEHGNPAVAAAGEDTHLLRPSLERSSSRLKSKPSQEHAAGAQPRPSHEHVALLAKRHASLDEDPQEGYAAVDTAPKAVPRWVIMPQSRFRRTWIMATLVVAFYIIWVTPIRVGFDMQAQGPWFWIEGIIDIYFYIDLALNFFTAYENPVTSEVITDHKLIAKRYLSSWFWVDLLATFPSDYIIKGVQGTWSCSFHNNCDPSVYEDSALSAIALLRLTRFFRIIWIFKNFNVLSVQTIIGRIMDELITLRWMFSMLELLVVLIFLGHLCGCFFYMFSHPKWQTGVEQQMVAEGEMSTWVLDKMGGYDIVQYPQLLVPPNGSLPVASEALAQDPDSGAWYECPAMYAIYTCTQCQGMQLRCRAKLGNGFRYISAMYWAYTTMTTVGYGDIYATTTAEKVWAMFTMVIGGFFLSFCFGRIASIVSRLDADRAARAEQMESVSQFLHDHELPKAISRKVIEFFKTNVKGVKPYDRGAMLARMPFDLRSRILQHLYDTFIKNIPMLHKLCQEDGAFMADFTIRLQPYHTSADTFVYQKGELTADVFILVRGDLYVVDPHTHTRVVKIAEGTIFGESNFVKHLQGAGKTKREESVRCDTACDMLRLAQEDASALCEVYPELATGLTRLDRKRQHQLAHKEHPPTLSSPHTQLSTPSTATAPPGPPLGSTRCSSPFGSQAALAQGSAVSSSGHVQGQGAAQGVTWATQQHPLASAVGAGPGSGGLQPNSALQAVADLPERPHALHAMGAEQQARLATELQAQGRTVAQLPTQLAAPRQLAPGQHGTR